MTAKVKLSEVLAAMECPENWEAYLDPATGQIVVVTEEDREHLEDEDLNEEGLLDWERESLAGARRADETPGLLELPDRFEVHEWDIMRRFASAQGHEASLELLNAIQGSGAFRRFRSRLGRLGLRKAWYEFRSNAFRQVATEWLDANGIEYIEDAQ
jgi:hypothetical protein